jgi:hypothetical protein
MNEDITHQSPQSFRLCTARIVITKNGLTVPCCCCAAAGSDWCAGHIAQAKHAEHLRHELERQKAAAKAQGISLREYQKQQRLTND